MEKINKLEVFKHAFGKNPFNLHVLPISLIIIIMSSIFFPHKYDCHLNYYSDQIKCLDNNITQDCHKLIYDYHFDNCEGGSIYLYYDENLLNSGLDGLLDSKCYKIGPICDFGEGTPIGLYFLFSVGLLGFLLWLILGIARFIHQLNKINMLIDVVE